MDKTKLIVVAGPTASGKTNLAVQIAKAVGGSVICADSMQVYKGMGIATAAPTKQEMQGVPHMLNEFLDRSVSFSVSDFCSAARKAVSQITASGSVPVIAGGTGLFIDSFVDNVSFSSAAPDEELRAKLMQLDEDELFARLLQTDPAEARKTHKNNKKRVVRALEIYYSTGKTKTELDLLSRRQSPYDVLYLVIGFKNRDLLYSRINARVDQMVASGLEEEARINLASGGKTAAQAIGHKELAPYFAGEISFDAALEKIKQETRRYAKRQITWFKRRENAVWLYADELGYDKLAEKAVDLSRDFLNGKQ